MAVAEREAWSPTQSESALPRKRPLSTMSYIAAGGAVGSSIR